MNHVGIMKTVPIRHVSPIPVAHLNVRVKKDTSWKRKNVCLSRLMNVRMILVDLIKNVPILALVTHVTANLATIKLETAKTLNVKLPV